MIQKVSLQFEWDPRKAHGNEVSHEVSFEEALTVFRDPLARIFDDEQHSQDEPSEIIIGHSTEQHLILVCFTVRGERVRLIGARKATRLEREHYEKNASR